MTPSLFSSHVYDPGLLDKDRRHAKIEFRSAQFPNCEFAILLTNPPGVNGIPMWSCGHPNFVKKLMSCVKS